MTEITEFSTIIPPGWYDLMKRQGQHIDRLIFDPEYKEQFELKCKLEEQEIAEQKKKSFTSLQYKLRDNNEKILTIVFPKVNSIESAGEFIVITTDRDNTYTIPFWSDEEEKKYESQSARRALRAIYGFRYYLSDSK